ncbi:MAG: Uma2 family endonuclease [Ardenticatenales bacterium]
MPRTAPPVVDPTHRPKPPSPVRRPQPAPVPRSAPDDAPSGLPPLCNGDRLTQPEFHRRYLATPKAFHAELIEGMVFVMASPISLTKHAGPQGFLIGWLSFYAANTVGTKALGPITLIIDNENEVEPDAMLRVDHERGGSSRPTDDDFLSGVPELVVEVAASSAAYDLNIKKHLYARIGVPEYIVATAHERGVHWFVLRDGEYVELAPDDDGVYRSPTWPGLWLPADALWAHDLAAAIATTQAGIATDAHAAFVARLGGTGDPAMPTASTESTTPTS